VIGGSTARWLQSFNPATPGAPRVVCFPHAGGTAQFFRPLADALYPDIEVLAVQYPGRQDRRREPVATDLRALARRLAPELARLPGTDLLAFFGHSMGSLIAFETAALGEAGNGPRPDVLIASGSRAPAHPRTDALDLDSDQAVIEEVLALGGTAPAVLADEDLRQLILPVIRGDYRALRAYSAAEGARLRCPITVMTGLSDPRVTLAQAQRWQDNTTGRFEVRTFTGGHFYLAGRETEVAAAIRTELSALV
jgi:surfactin synthase thioesterase subunit